MTRAERREIQERQRAAKAAQKQQQQQGQQQGQASSSKSKAQNAPQKKADSGRPRASSSAVPALKDMSGAMSGAADSKTRGLRIFSHFGLPKTLGHQVKGDIHPVIIRLGLQFSEFKICGANARCIATLTAFKTVRSLAQIYKVFCNLIFIGHSRLYHTRSQYPVKTPHDISFPANIASSRR